MRSQTLTIIVLATATTACGWGFFDFPYRQIEGRALSPGMVQKVQDGQTTEAELLDWFGPPSEVTDVANKGRKKVRYVSVKQATSVAKGPLGQRVTERTIREELAVTIWQGRVEAHKLSVNESSHRTE
jgi:hypothetical protein